MCNACIYNATEARKICVFLHYWSCKKTSMLSFSPKQYQTLAQINLNTNPTNRWVQMYKWCIDPYKHACTHKYKLLTTQCCNKKLCKKQSSSGFNMCHCRETRVILTIVCNLETYLIKLVCLQSWSHSQRCFHCPHL